MPGELDRLAACEQVGGRVGAARGSGGRELRGSLEQVALALRHPDGRAGALGEVGDAADVVEVAVRDEDPGARGTRLRELEPELGGFPPGSITAASAAPRSSRTT